MKKVLLFFCSLFLTAAPIALCAQEQPSLSYYLPPANYDPAIPTPAAYLGFEVGEWHASHDQLLGYMRELARVSPRFRLREYGRTHENRPLINITITHPDQMSRLDNLRQQRQALADPSVSSPNPADVPAAIYMGYSIHGNETSGSNAALLVAYWLAAAQGAEVDQMLRQVVILFDPCFNPDGMQRFSSWVNSRRSKTLQPDPSHDEFNEHWPGGRFNHYWFDLNRDWLMMQQPESEGRVRIFQEWLPNVLTDHHEMGSNSTFFFQPGVPSRVNPVTPPRNQQLTADIARYHVKALSEKGIQFYSGENFDDFYYGKGSSYPDANGCVGILFEQGSSRGSAQETNNGLLTFPYSIRNQVITSFSTLRAVLDKRVEMNEYLRDFYRDALAESRKSPVKGYILQAPHADAKGWKEALRILSIHRIQVQWLQKDINIDGATYLSAKAVVVPVEQRQYRLIRGVFERLQTFTDSIFYDISAWTLPDAFGLQWAPLDARKLAIMALSDKAPASSPLSPTPSDAQVFGYLISADAEDLPALLVQLHQRKYRVKVATKAVAVQGRLFQPGTLFIPRDRQSGSFDALKGLLSQSAAWPACLAVESGDTEKGPWLGSSSFVNCQSPKVLMATGPGVNALDAGEIWHYLDTRMGLPPVLVESDRIAGLNLGKYNTLILPDGKYQGMPTEKIREFVNNGGTLIATGRALQWLKSAGLSNVEARMLPPVAPAQIKQLPFNGRADLEAARNMPGAIFKAIPDITHPLCYGYAEGEMPVFLPENQYLEPSGNPWQHPLVLTEDPLLAGYMHPTQKSLAAGAAGVVVSQSGNGRIVHFGINPNFRGFWYGTQRLMGNAVLFGNALRGGGGFED